MASFWQAVKSVISNLRLSRPERPEGPRLFFNPRTQAGLTVTHDTALTWSAIWCATRVIAESLAMMPWHVMREAENGAKVRQATHPADFLLHQQANPETPAGVFRETMAGWVINWGNAYAEIERDGADRPVWLWQIPPDRVEIHRDENGQLFYLIKNRFSDPTAIPAKNMLHIKGLGFDGVQGYSVVSMARQSIGLGLATERFGASFFGNGSHLGSVLQHPGKLGKDATTSQAAQSRIRESWEKIFRGPDNASRIAILEEGMTYQRIGVPPEDAQFLETRQFQIEEVSRWYRVTPHKLHHLLRATFNNIEHLGIEFVTDALMPWVIRFEQEANWKLFGQNRQGLFTKLNVMGLLRGDQKSRFDSYAVGRQWGFLSVNDIRRLEDMDPLPDTVGDTYLTPLNMQALPASGQQPAPPPTSPQRQDPRQWPAPVPRLKNAYTRLFEEPVKRIQAYEHRKLNALKETDYQAVAGVYQACQKYAVKALRPALYAIAELSDHLTPEMRTSLETLLQMHIQDYCEMQRAVILDAVEPHPEGANLEAVIDRLVEHATNILLLKGEHDAIAKAA